MKGFQWLTFTLLSLTSIALIITGMATKHWTATRSGTGTIFGDQNNQIYGGLRRWYSDGVDSRSWARTGASNDFYKAGSWALGWGITAIILILLSHIVITIVKGVDARPLHGLTGKIVSAGLMFLAAVCILIGCLTYWSHLPDGYDSLSWSYALYVMGGGLALLTSILLCSMPNKHYARTVVVTKTAQPTIGGGAPMYMQSGQHSRTSSIDAGVAPNHVHNAPTIVVQ